MGSFSLTVHNLDRVHDLMAAFPPLFCVRLSLQEGTDVEGAMQCLRDGVDGFVTCLLLLADASWPRRFSHHALWRFFSSPPWT